MTELDFKYLAELVLRAQEGDSDSFAELYVATYQQQYRFSYRYLQDEFLAQDALQETYILALKNLACNQKIEVVSRRSTREKLMAYLLLQAKRAKKSTFLIPFDRQELADYLEVDRSGLSTEIGKLRREGVIDCEKNRFTIKMPL